MATTSDVGDEFLKSGNRLITQTNSDPLLEQIAKGPKPLDATPRTKWVMAMEQIAGAVKLLGGEVNEQTTLDLHGLTTNKIIITYNHRDVNDPDPYAFEGNYEGPLYAPHPDLVNKDEE